MRLKRIFISLVILLILLQGLNHYLAQMHNEGQVVASSEPAPDFVWKATDGTTHHLDELKGKPVVLHFWASWCAPCRDEFPQLLAAASVMPDVIFLTVSGDEQPQEREQFLKRAQIFAATPASTNVLYAADPDKTLTFQTFQTAVYPETILLDASHHMRRKFPGPMDWKSAEVRSLVMQTK